MLRESPSLPLNRPTELGLWPAPHSFALFLSHDVDQIHDRELFRVLADVNHVRRHVLQGERGHLGHALARITRSLVRPKDPLREFDTILGIEARHGFRSTWFLLHDRYWARHGGRYSLADPALGTIARNILAAGGELGVHGGYYRFNDAALYRDSRDAVERHFGVRPVGIRNHLLRFSTPETWLAHEAAGFAYDATFARPDHLGPLADRHHPFHPTVDGGARRLRLLEFPITVMDATLFRYHRLAGEDALEAAWRAILPTVHAGGLVSLLWHNNYFDEPEYHDWQFVYEQLLARLAALRPWCAPGAEIHRWLTRPSAPASTSTP